MVEAVGAAMVYCEATLSIVSSVATLTGVCVGVYGYLDYWRVHRKKRVKLEEYLKEAKQKAATGKKGQHTAMHLTRHVGLTEDEILQLSFESKKIELRVGPDEKGKADHLLFEYVEKKD